MRTTRKTNQIDIDLGSIKDEPTRIALAQLVGLVNSMSGTGIDTEGTLKARNGMASGFADDTGLIMWKVVKGTLGVTGAQSHYSSYTLPGRVLGVSGWAQFAGTTEWRLLGRASATNTVFISNAATAPQNYENVVVFQNSDATHENGYRAVIFYEPTVIDRQAGIQ